MNERREKFCVEFVRCGNATEAYRAAGYKPKSAHAAEVLGSNLLRIIEVQRRIAELRGKLEDEKIMDAAERRRILTDIARDKKGNTKCRIMAIDTMNKMDGVYIQKTQLSGTDGGPLSFRWEDGGGGK